jgi:phosphohistidine phosphatase
MKTLLILRHAKAEPPAEEMSDFDRPLAERGEQDAPRVGHWLRDEGLAPQLILSSSAARAKATAELVAKACHFDGPLEFFRDLYMARAETYIEKLREHGGQHERVMVVGHNPTLDELLFALTAEHEGFPTAGLAVVELAIDYWEELQLPTRHKLCHFVKGKELH